MVKDYNNLTEEEQKRLDELEAMWCGEYYSHDLPWWSFLILVGIGVGIIALAGVLL